MDNLLPNINHLIVPQIKHTSKAQAKILGYDQQEKNYGITAGKGNTVSNGNNRTTTPQLSNPIDGNQEGNPTAIQPYRKNSDISCPRQHNNPTIEKCNPIIA